MIEVLNKYGIIAIIIGGIACIFCGVIKIPVAKAIRKSGAQNGISDKKTSDRIRNFCNFIVALISCVGVLAWYGILNGAQGIFNSKIFAEILTAFTASKLFYMVYEGAGAVSIKQGVKNLIKHIKSSGKEIDCSAITLTQAILDFFEKEINLPLTDEQTILFSQKMDGLTKP